MRQVRLQASLLLTQLRHRQPSPATTVRIQTRAKEALATASAATESVTRKPRAALTRRLLRLLSPVRPIIRYCLNHREHPQALIGCTSDVGQSSIAIG